MIRMRLALLVVMAMLFCMGAWGQDEANQARQDLAKRLQVKAEQIAISRAEEVTWPDTSLGCPEPDKMYAQVLVPGYRVLLKVGGEEYEYHTDRKGQAVYCARHIAIGNQTPPVVERARQNLAQRLGCTPGEITVVEAPFVEWPTIDPATPDWERERPFPKEVKAGYRAVLNCDGKQYEYHTDLIEEAAFTRELPAGAPESYRIAFLRLAERPDGHNLWELAVRNSVTGEITVPVRHVVDFAVAPDSGRIIFLRRQPNDQVALVTLANPDRPVLTAANLQGLGWDPSGKRYVVWMQEQPKGPWRLVIGEVGQEPTLVQVPAAHIAPGVPSAVQWQGDLGAFTFTDVNDTASFLLRWPQAQISPLTGKFMGWLDQPGKYLVIQDGRLSQGDLQDPDRFTIIADMPDLVWARPLPDGEGYLAMTQVGNLLRLWRGEVAGGQAPQLLSDLEGQLVQAQLGQRGTVLMVQQVEQRSDRRGQCKVTLVETLTGNQEPLSGVCVRAQLLPMR